MIDLFEKYIRKSNPVSTYTNEVRELNGCHGAILATDGFEQSELFGPKAALEKAGAIVHVISLQPGRIRGWSNNEWGRSVQVDMTVREAWSIQFDFLVLPGGVMSPDKLRNNAEAVAFVMSFGHKGRPVAAICHGIQTLIETGYLKGKRVTSWPSLRTDLANAGAKWVDQEVVVDEKIITSRKPSDIPAFNAAMIEQFSQDKIHSTQNHSVSEQPTL
ncbi:MAG TPA: type 1 glutamine amidotransferase domain-containing protein [Bacteriovoracaceae bacterium]|nr:type 1 glutamine amidotransferase domain-containing protein [Bacteriovoracaceae bacterium]